MNYGPQHHQVALTFISGIGSKRARSLIAHFSDLEEFFREKQLNLSKIPGVPADFVTYKHRKAALEEADRVLEHCARIGLQTVFFTEERYSRRLKNCIDAPLLLYIKGDPDLNPEKSVSIVGTRYATEYGKELTGKLVEELAPTGAAIVSGMAYGIDIAAHKSALKNGLPTIGVLGHGLHVLYPAEHKRIAGEMLEAGGLISEFPPGLKPEPSYFPMRNRIVAGMSDATVVIESGEKGGSLITANLANDYNRDVFAFPGDVSRELSRGCLKLIQDDKAHLLITPGDLPKLMGWDADVSSKQQPKLFYDLNKDEEMVMTVLKTSKDLPHDVIAYMSSMTPGKVSEHLLDLEFKGLVRSLPGKRFALA
jgi:DNA processing protein